MGSTLVIGCGLMGTSVGLALRRVGATVFLRDLRADHVGLAESLGAGSARTASDITLVVVAVPPDHVAEVVVDALQEWPVATVTDLASVKAAPLVAVRASASDATRYVGGHPMAGSERSGPIAASAQLFDGRSWAVTPHVDARPESVQLVRDLVTACGAVLVELSAGEHDAAVAKVSHLPHLMSVLTAGQLLDSPDEQLALAGQGLRDVTRIAGSDPRLWCQILAANADELTRLLSSVRDQINLLLAGDDLLGVLQRGVEGTRTIPGKHGQQSVPLVTVYVQIPDEPGQLARLFAHADESGVNVEDLRIDHDLGRPVGLAEVVVRPDQADTLVASLVERGWSAYR